MVDARLSRRSALLGLAAAAPTLGRPVAAAAAPRIAAIDWGLAETLAAIGAPPIGLAESRGYRDWVSQPAMPPGVAEIGLRAAPSLDYLFALKPDLIVSTPQFSAIEQTLRRVARVLSLATFTEAREPLTNAIANARRLGAETGRVGQAERLISDLAARIERARRPERARRKALVVVFLDERRIWAFGRGSLFDAVLTSAGLENAWDGEASPWGNANVSVDALARFADVATIVVEPVPVAVRARLSERTSGLAARLPAFREGGYRFVRPVWAFGGLPSAGRFADALADLGDFLDKG